MAKGEIEFVFNKKTGTTEIEMKNFKGDECVGEANDILKVLGKNVQTTNKNEFYQSKKDRVRDSH
jgi:hypothetical protein